MKMWKGNAGPCMQILHFSFALGAFFAPLLAKPFISEEADDEVSSNAVSSCAKLLDETPFVFDNETRNANDSFETNCTLLLAICSDLSANYSLGSVYVDVDLLISGNCSNATDASNSDPGANGSLLFAWAYWIAAVFFVPPLVAFIYYAVRLELLQRFRKSLSAQLTASQEVDREELNDCETAEIGSPEEVVEDVDRGERNDFETSEIGSPEDVVQDVDTGEQNDIETSEIVTPEDVVQDVDKAEQNDFEIENPEDVVSMKQSLCYRILLLTLLFNFMFFYVGLEVAFGSFIFTVAVKGELQFSKQKAALLTSVFWGTFAFTRLFSVLLALVKTPASWMMTGNMSGSLLAASIMLAFPHNATAIWIGAAVLGTSYASIYPTTMTWFAEHTEVTGKTTAVLVTGGTLGDIALPAAVGFLVGHVTPDSLVYFTFVGILVSAVFLALLFLSACIERRHRRKRSAGIATVHYTRVTEDASENGLTVDGGGVVDDVESGDEVRLLDNEEL